MLPTVTEDWFGFWDSLGRGTVAWLTADPPVRRVVGETGRGDREGMGAVNIR